MVLTDAEMGSLPRSKHQQSHCFQADEYASSVEDLHDILRFSITVSAL